MNRDKIEELVNTSLSTRQIADRLKTSQSNIRYWLSKFNIKTNVDISESDSDIFNRSVKIVLNNKSLYNYVFGLYLGDGHTYKIKNKKNLHSLSITLDLKYPKVIEEVKTSVEILLGTKSQIINKKSNCVELKFFSNTIKYLFPKYGIGNKHLNKVFLPKILTDNIDYGSLAKGLFQSDGSYYYDRKNKKYFYGFSNKSVDISNIYINCLDNLDIKYDYNVKSNGIIHVNVRNRENVSKFRDIVGVKD